MLTNVHVVRSIFLQWSVACVVIRKRSAATSSNILDTSKCNIRTGSTMKIAYVCGWKVRSKFHQFCILMDARKLVDFLVMYEGNYEIIPLIHRSKINEMSHIHRNVTLMELR